MIGICHVNWHTFDNKPVFQVPEYERFIFNALWSVINEKKIVCLVLNVMPTHVHAVFADFPDQKRSDILQYVKGITSRLFFERFPTLRHDLGEGHLWQRGSDKVFIVSHRQLVRTIEYIKTNRAKKGLKHSEEAAIPRVWHYGQTATG